MPVPNRKIFKDGLNADDTDFAIGEGEYINMENLRWGTTDKGSVGHLEAISGNALTDNAALPIANPTICIGRATDEARQRILYFINCPLNADDDCILAYDKADDICRMVCQSIDVTGGLNFDKDHLIHSANVVEDLLYWTEDYNNPRRINTEAGIKLYDPSYTTTVLPYSTPINQEVIALIRKPPGLPPFAAKATDGAILENNVEDFAGFFAYRYQYRDNEYSVFSAPSALVPYNKPIVDVFNYVGVTADVNELIEQDVQRVEFAVRYGYSSQYFIIKTWDRENTDDAADIAAHNLGTPLSYQFVNNKSGVAVSNADSVKPYDSVSLLSATQEVADNRLFLGNNLVGYDTPTKTSLIWTLLTDTNTVWQNPIFKTYSQYKLGVRFRDKYKRIMGNVVTNDTLTVQIPDRVAEFSGSQTYTTAIMWTLDNTSALDEIPLDAYFYEVLYTKNLRTRFFVQSEIDGAQYVMKDATTGLYTYQNGYDALGYGVAFGLNVLIAKGKAYNYQPGDLVRFYNGTNTPVSLRVLGTDAGYVICQLYDFTSIVAFAPSPGGITQTVIEIYTPYREIDFEPYYTYGLAHPVLNPGTSGRVYTTITDDIFGDVYFQGANYPEENMSKSDKLWIDWFTNHGEPNYVIASKQLRKKVAIQFSSKVLQGTKINGLSSFDALDEKDLSFEVGAIRRLIRTSKVQGQQGLVMLGICETETVSMYLGETQLVGSDANAFVATSSGVIGTVYVLKGSHGTSNPESVIEFRGDVYWLDMRNGMFVEYSVNGLDVVSDFKLRRFSKLFCDKFKSMTSSDIEALGNRPYVFGMVDKYHNEVLWTIPKLEENPRGNITDVIIGGSDDDPLYLPYPYDFYDGQAKTIVYKLGGAQKWVGSYRIVPEMWATIGSDLYAFNAGSLYHCNDTTAGKNVFFDVQYDSRIMFLCNVDPLIVKIYLLFAIEANVMPSFVHMRSEYPDIQSSTLDASDFTTAMEGIWYATIQRDRLSPNSTGTPDEIEKKGDKMRNTALRIMLQWTSVDLAVDFTDVKLVTTTYNPSNGHSV